VLKGKKKKSTIWDGIYN